MTTNCTKLITLNKKSLEVSVLPLDMMGREKVRSSMSVLSILKICQEAVVFQKQGIYSILELQSRRSRRPNVGGLMLSLHCTTPAYYREWWGRQSEYK